MAKQQIRLNARGPGILDGRQVRAMAFAPAREQLLDRILHERSWPRAGERRALVVGGGYSPLAVALRDRGFVTTAVDSSASATALGAADASGVEWRTARPSELQVEPSSFDLVYCADTLEVEADAAVILAALAAAAKPGATVVLDTVTDTLVARLIYLVAFQRLPWTRIMPSRRYSANRLRGPRLLTQASQYAGLSVDDVIGFEPKSVGSLVRAILDRRSGRITDAELPGAAGFRLSVSNHAPVVTYFAVATNDRS
ncbi:class I SAM-dependent methyltransferase [Brevibacterium picturae]|uniref:class I SAM-dependent methyltransferase n=1 Tax=Brevibacterium picturae TaxID=260553 RepID=UPI0031F74963